MATVGWIIWILILLFNLSLSYGSIKSIVSGQSVTYATLGQTVVFWVVLALFYFNPEWNKLHLVWVAPASFLAIAFLVPQLIMRQ